MTAGEKIALALKGDKTERGLLIRDANKMVSRGVLQSPKVTDQEIESFAAMRNVSEEILRLIGSSRKFMKSYNILRCLVNNPRTPLDVSLRLLPSLMFQDVKFLSINRNIPETLRKIAVRKVKEKSAPRSSGFGGKH
ncbi:MAG: hypothetical protein O6850_01295 [Acidobacteria bacterium]|nr:hypothetical protein [Acidobacteriota bacterium]